MKKITLLFIFLLISCFSFSQDVYITGYIDSSCPQAKGRTLEIYVSGTVNLSAWNLVRQSNGNGYTNNISISNLGTLTDEFAYITNDEVILNQEFDIENANVIQTGAINDNGDDAFQIQDQFGNIIDRFGEEGVQPNINSDWFHRKTYYYRKNGESPNHGNFDSNNWIFGEIDLLVGEGLCNDGEAYENLVPFGTFDPNLCEVITGFPYLQDFESSNPPFVHNCESLEGENNQWETAEIDKNGFSGKVLKYSSSESQADAWFFTRNIYLESGMDYIVEFKYGNNDPLSNEKLKIAYRNSGETSNYQTLKDLTEINSGQAQYEQIVFNVAEDGDYEIGFQAFSDANQNELYIDDIQIDIAENCLHPFNIQVENLGIDSAEITWMDNNDSNISWDVVYGEGDFDPENEGTNISTSENQIELENLEAGNHYRLYVKSNCDTENSAFSEKIDFITLCEASDENYSEDFENIDLSEIPFCSRTENGSAGNSWETKEIFNHGFDGKVLTYSADSNNPALAWFFTQGIFLQAETLYQLDYIYGNNSTSHTEKLRVAYGNSPDSEAMNSELADYSAIDEAEAKMGEHIFEVDEDGIYYFGFLAYSDADQGELYLDEIHVQTAPSCLRPTQVNVENISENSAEISWTDSNSAEDYEIVYGLYGFDPETEGENISTTGNPNVVLQNLLSGTTYQVYVKNICDDTDSSEFSFAKNFTTQCTVQEIPYAEDFELAIAPQLPNCTSLENIGSGNLWEVYDETQAESPIFNSKVLRYEFHPQHAGNVWFFTNAVHLEPGINYQLEYSYANSTTNPNYFEKMKVGLGNSAEASTMEILADHTHISDGEINTNQIVFSVSAEGNYHIGFNAYSNFMASSLYLDNIHIDLGPTCPAPYDIYYSNLNHESVDLEWEYPQNNTNWEVKYGSYGFDPENDGFGSYEVQGEAFLHLDNLQAETFYDVYVRSICGDENSEWEGPKTFKTKINPPSNTYLCDAIQLELNEDCENQVFTNIGAFSEAEEPEACFNYPGKTVWFSFTAPENGEVIVNASFFGDVLTSEIAVFEAPEDCENPESLGEEIGCAGYGSAMFLEGLIAGNTYYIQVAANNNKEGDFCIEVFSDSNMSLEDFAFENFSFYPNPVKDQLQLKAGNSISNITFYDLQGRIIRAENPNANNWKTDMASFNSGIYLMKVDIDGKEKYFKVVKE